MTDDLIERLTTELKEIGGCYDRDCKVYVTPGMHTNGGCRCLRDTYTAQRVFRAYKRAVDDQAHALSSLQARVKELEGEETRALWVTTAPNPRSSAMGFDAGQRGWKLHAIRGDESESFADIKRRPSLCGLIPRHGWGLDLFIEDRCARCASKLARSTLEKS